MQIGYTDEEKQALFDEARNTIDCPHEWSEFRTRTIRGGAVQIVRQCMRCGDVLPNPLAKKDHPGWASYPPVDPSIVERFRASGVGGLQVLEQRINERWRSDYSRYLDSPEWAAMRDAVMFRDKGTCQGCLSEPATEVHHLTYRNVGDELLFQLVAICSACHQKAHGNDPATERARPRDFSGAE